MSPEKTLIKARKQHRCESCGSVIVAGEYYARTSNYSAHRHSLGSHHGAGGFHTRKLCKLCWQDADFINAFIDLIEATRRADETKLILRALGLTETEKVE